MSLRFEELRRELPEVLKLALPLVAAEVGWMFMGIVDTLMVGRLENSAAAIGAVSLGTNAFYTIAVCTGSLMMGLDTLVSQAFGARRFNDCHRALWAALFLLIPVVPITMAAITGVTQLFGPFGVNEAVRQGAANYALILRNGLPGLMLYFAMRRYLQGMGHVGVVSFALLSANLINVAGNWALIYGHWGFPALGTDGSAWATVASRYYMAGVLVAYTLYIEHRDAHGIFTGPIRPDFTVIRKLLSLGIPAATHVGLEMAIFGLATFMVARLTPRELAAHQIALNMAALTFMVPLGISSAAAVRVGHRIGAGDPVGAGRSGSVAISLGAAFMTLSAIFLWLFPVTIAKAYTADPGVIQSAVGLLAIAAVFQLFDGVQIVSSGALRGAGDTRTPMLCNFFYYWIVGLPLGYWLAFSAGYGAVGIWTGLCAGLVLIGSTLIVVWTRKVAAFRSQIGY